MEVAGDGPSRASPPAPPCVLAGGCVLLCFAPLLAPSPAPEQPADAAAAASPEAEVVTAPDAKDGTEELEDLVEKARACVMAFAAAVVAAAARRFFNWVEMDGNGGIVATVIKYWIIDFVTLALWIMPPIIDLEYNDNGELIFKNISLIAIFIKCLRIFMTACHAAHIMGFVEALGLFLASLIGFCFHSIAIAIHLSSIRKSCAQTWMIGIAIYMGVGIGWLQYGMLIPVNQAWHAAIVPLIIILTVLVEAILGVCSQISEDGSNQHLHLDLIMKLVETSIAIYRTVDCTQRDYHFQIEKLLVLLWNSLIVLIGTCQIGWIVYKAGIICKVLEWFGKLLEKARKNKGAAKGGVEIPQVRAVEEELAAEVAVECDRGRDVEERAPEATMEKEEDHDAEKGVLEPTIGHDGDGNVEEQAAERGVVVVVPA